MSRDSVNLPCRLNCQGKDAWLGRLRTGHVIPWAVVALIASCVVPAASAQGGPSVTRESPIKLSVLREWRFSDVTPDAKAWRFFPGARAITSSGVAVERFENGPVLLHRALDVRALDVARVRINIGIDHDDGTGEKPLPPQELRVYWARGADTGRAAGWPFDGERSSKFQKVKAGESWWEADVSTHGNWVGTIKQLFVGLNLPDRPQGAENPVRVTVRAVQLMAERWELTRAEYTAADPEDRRRPGAPGGVPADSTGRAAQATPSSTPQRVLFLLIDTLRADHLGCLGYERDTSPFLDSLAGQSTLFEFAIAQGDGTVYSMPTIFTGKFYSQLFADPPEEGGVPANETTIAELFQRGGFKTTGWSTNPYVSRRMGYDQGFDDFHELWPVGVVYSRIEHVIRTVRRTYKPADGPEFLYVHLMDAHSPYFPPAPYHRKWAAPYDGWAFRNGRMKGLDQKEAIGLHPYWAETHDVQPADIRYAMSQYDGEIRYLDDYLPELLDALRYAPARDLLVIGADHGEQFYEHGFLGHNKSTLLEEIHVPLMIRHPAYPARRVSTPVANVDLLPTFCDIYGFEAPGGVSGRSLLPAVRGEPLEARPLFSEASPSRGVVGVAIAGDWLYYLNIRHNRLILPWRLRPITELLFNLENDPRCAANVAPDQPQARHRMNATLRQLSPRFAHATPAALDAMDENVSFGPSLLAGEAPTQEMRLDAGNRTATYSFHTENPHEPHLLSFSYTLEDARLDVRRTPEVNDRQFYRYSFFRPRSEPREFRVVFSPNEEEGQLTFTLAGDGAARLLDLRCRHAKVTILPVPAWEGASETSGLGRELTQEEIDRLKALGYVH